jgi:hypothetical protein
VLSAEAVGADIYLAVERTINGTLNHYLEVLSSAHYMDCSTRKTTGLGTTVAGFDHLDGEPCQVYADWIQFGEQTPSSGDVTFDEAPTEFVEVGLDFPDVKELYVQRLIAAGVNEADARLDAYGSKTGQAQGDGVWIRDMPVEPRLPNGAKVGEKKRVCNVDVQVYLTQHCYIGANGRPPQLVTWRKYDDDLLDKRPPIKSGFMSRRGLLGYTKKGQVEITQRGPGPLHVLSIAKDVDV